MIEEVSLQAAAATRIAGKSGMIAAATTGDVGNVMSCLMADANCVNEREHDLLDCSHCTLLLLHLCLKFVAEFVLWCIVFLKFTCVIFCSSYKRRIALHLAAPNGNTNVPAAD